MKKSAQNSSSISDVIATLDKATLTELALIKKYLTYRQALKRLLR